jgi:hypothetical protein
MGAAFAFTEAAVSNQRQKNDPWNGASGACAAGFLAGIKGKLICFRLIIRWLRNI